MPNIYVGIALTLFVLLSGTVDANPLPISTPSDKTFTYLYVVYTPSVSYISNFPFFPISIYEYDFTYSDEKVSKSAAEAGWRIDYKLREGVKFSSDGYYRKYLSYSQYVPEDLSYDFLAVARLDTNVWGDLTMGPYVKYRRAHSRSAIDYASNTSIGISFSYIHNFDLMYKLNKDAE